MDVKKIFISIDMLLIVLSIVTIVGLIITIKQKNLHFLKQTSLILLILILSSILLRVIYKNKFKHNL